MSALSTDTHHDSALASAVRDGVARATAVAGLGAVALIHLLDVPDTFEEQAYKGWLFVGLIVGCLAAAIALIRTSSRHAWLAATLLPLGALAAYVYSRTIGLPGGADDIGNWTESLGLASMFVDGSLVALGASVIHSRVTERWPLAVTS
jgi:hypothetical protein